MGIMHCAPGSGVGRAVGRNDFCEMLPATANKLVMVHMWLKIETMKESGKWEADLLQHTDEDLTWEQITSLDED